MRLERLGVDESVGVTFPPALLVEELADQPIAVDLVDASSESLDRYDGVVTFYHHESLFDVPWVHSIQAGVDRFPHDRFRDAGIVLTNSSGIHGDAIGETVAGYVLALARRLHDYIGHQADREWHRPNWDDAWTVHGQRACVVGVGGLGRGVVDRLDSLGLDVVGVRRTPLPEPGANHVYPADDLHEALADARFVVVTVPLTDATREMFGRAEFEAMDEEAYFINVARGGVVDQPAMVEALQKGSIAGGALDVFETEPLPEESPLWNMDDVIVTPHAGAYTRTYYEDIAAIVRESLRRIRADEDPVNRVL